MQMTKQLSKGKSSRGKNDRSSSIEKLLQITSSAAQTWAGPSKAAISRWETLPLLFGAESGKSEAGHIVGDSWYAAPALALRDIDDGHIRWLKLKAGKVTLEIVAERMTDHWEFVARVNSKGKVENNYVLKVGHVRLLPYSEGFYHWSSKWVPRSVKLLSFNRQLNFERILW
jgi:hypothetical protein